MEPGIWIARVLALVGFADAAYLTATHYAGAPVFCGASGGCETVLTSGFATLGPVPIALLGAVYYAITSLAAWTPMGSWSRGTAAFLAGLTGLALAVSGALFWIQAVVIDAWCRFCLVSAVITLLLFATAVWLLSRIRHSRPVPQPDA
ncbi:MAG: vitamin K epoxide reductase family protein [Gemmatimonadota bacterium]